MGRRPCCSKEGLKRGAWTAMEDKMLASYIRTHGEGKWRNLPKRAGLQRCGKSCRLRWLNYLRPGIKRGNISDDEEDLIIRLHKLLGNRWSLIAGRLPGRTDNEIKNYWNTNLGKRVNGQSCQRSKHKQKATASSKGENPESSEQRKALDDANVVRTKAIRCTRAFFPQDQQMPLPQNSIIKELESLSEPVQGNCNSSSYLRMDLEYDFLQSMGDHQGIQEGGGSATEEYCSAGMVTTSYDDHLLMMDGEKVEDWLNYDSFQADIEFDPKYLTSLLDSEGAWFQI